MLARQGLFGRRVIYTDVDEITADNVISVLEHAMTVHEQNRAEIQYLYDYYKGNQPILQRVKEVRSDICNKIVENRANEIVSFKVGYLMGEPVQYVNRGDGDDETAAALNILNSFAFAEDKAAKDKELADWFTICGTAYRMVLPDVLSEEDEAPFELYTLDPRYSFVVYHSGLGNRPMMGVKYVRQNDGTVIFSVYTRNRNFEITQPGVNGITIEANKAITRMGMHILGDIPIVEYPANHARLGAFEIVLPLLDAMNTVSSNRLDGVEQFIQSLLILKGVDIDSEEYKALKDNGGLKVPKEGDAFYLTQELNQTQTQTLVDYMYQTVLVICGMPNRNGGSSTSDTGSAVIMRDGWSDAEARAKDSEQMFKLSEKRFLKIALNIANTLRDMKLRLSMIDIRFTRRNYENIQAKAQVLTTMLSNPKIHPRLGFEHCGLFVDPDLAYSISEKYYQESIAREQKKLIDLADEATKNARKNATGATS